MSFWLVYENGYRLLSTNHMHVNVAQRTMINHNICFFSTEDAILVRSAFRKIKFERMFEVGRITDLNWRFHTFFVVPCITLNTEIIVCAGCLERASRALAFWTGFFVVAPKEREYMMTIAVIEERGRRKQS